MISSTLSMVLSVTETWSTSIDKCSRNYLFTTYGWYILMYTIHNTIRTYTYCISEMEILYI